MLIATAGVFCKAGSSSVAPCYLSWTVSNVWILFTSGSYFPPWIFINLSVTWNSSVAGRLARMFISNWYFWQDGRNLVDVSLISDSCSTSKYLRRWKHQIICKRKCQVPLSISLVKTVLYCTGSVNCIWADVVFRRLVIVWHSDTLVTQNSISSRGQQILIGDLWQ